MYWTFAELYRLFPKYAQFSTLPRVVPSMIMLGSGVVAECCAG